MVVQIALVDLHGSALVVALVDSAFTIPEAGTQLIEKIIPHFPGRPIVLVSIENNGYRAYAPFQTHSVLMLLQQQTLQFDEVDLDDPLPDEELPF